MQKMPTFVNITIFNDIFVFTENYRAGTAPTAVGWDKLV